MNKSFFKDLTIKYEKYKWWLWFFIGLLVVVLFLLPYYVLRENAYFMIHDELDDGIFKFVLYAKNFGVNGNFIPEFMGGQNRSSITVSAFWGILIYKLFEPYTAYAIMLTVVVLTGYIGLFLLGREVSDNAFASFAAASLFSYLPFKSMFGLNIVGFPLLIWILINLSRRKIKDSAVYYIALVFYATGITLAWGGYMSIGFLTLAIIIFAFFKRKLRLNLTNLVIADALLIVIQVITSWDLIASTFGPNAVVSHREELILNSRADLFNLFKEMMYVGGSHSECCSKVIALSAPVMIVLVPVLLHFLNKDKIAKAAIIKKKYAIMCIFYASCVLNSLFTCFYCSEPVVGLRQNIGGIFKTFQINRIYWMMPACFMCVMITEIAILLDIAQIFLDKAVFKKARFLSVFPALIALLLILVYSKNVYLSSPIYHNLRLMVFPNTYHVDSWRKYYAEDLFDEIEKTIGREKSDYKVACIGVNSSVALFNGFYTVDGYSTDYPLSYKHSFRKVIEKELDKDEDLKGYFDNWGNRCYLYTAALGNDFDIYRGEGVDIAPDWNIAELKKLGTDYILSGVNIENADALGLKLLNEEPLIKDEDSYAIRIYEIVGE